MKLTLRLGSIVAATLALLFAAGAMAPTAAAQATRFEAGSYIVPMDTSYQDTGMLRAYGLLYRLLRAGVPVAWVVDPAKAHGGVDFTTTARDHRTGAAIASHGYRGGPFVIAAADVVAGRPIVDAWQVLHPEVAVHEATVAFDGFRERLLVSAPTVAIFADGNETIAFGYLNAAGIPDSADRTWPTAGLASCGYTGRPEIMCPAQVAGSYTSHADGSLFDATGLPIYCQMMSMHWNVTDARTVVGEEVIQEYRSFLRSYPTHLFAECQAVNAIENSINGRFLTTTGFAIDTRPSSYDYYHDGLPFAQMDGPFSSVGGSEPSFTIPAGGAYLASDTVMISGSGDPSGVRDVWMTGYIGGACSVQESSCGALGKVSYLGGHRYTTAVPISGNPSTNGTRLFLNALFEADCARDDGQPIVSVAKSAPAIATSTTVTFTLAWSNTGRSVALRAALRDPLPPGATFVSATNGGTFDGTAVNWSLGNLGAGASGTVSVTVRVASAGHYANQATLTYYSGTTPRSTSSNTTDTAYGLDQDSDGLTDAQELAIGTSPYDADTDDDGVSDGAEVGRYGTNPLLADTDGDGLEDGTELGFVRVCSASCFTPPRCATTDTGPAFVPDTDCTTTTNPLDPRDPPRCPDGACNGMETCATCSADCGACPPPPPTCPDGVCNGTETCTLCPADCGACPPICGDGACNGTETCTSCASDCGACPPRCGDSTCNGTETCASCASDCGACPPRCGDGTCNGTETCTNCVSDCGACAPICGDAICNGIETCASCSGDCGACPPSCGDGACNGTETCTTCATDCGACPSTCGDGACTGSETCTTCPGDCGACVTCGNGVCDATETCSLCPVDCGTCTGTCGDSVCDATETCTSCPLDCGACSVACPNGVCGATEDCRSCAADCGACAATCGNTVCEPTETCTSCAVDCGSCPSTCGDAICDPTESCASCPMDCGACAVCGDGACTAGESCATCAGDCACADSGTNDAGANTDAGGGATDSGVGGDSGLHDSGLHDGGLANDGGLVRDGGARDGGVSADGSGLRGDGGGSGASGPSNAGCGCAVPRSNGGGSGGVLLAVLAISGLVRRRRVGRSARARA